MSIMIASARVLILFTILIEFAGCGTTIPQIGEVWEERDVNSQMAYHIKKNIFCELVTAIDEVNRRVKIKFPNAALNSVIPDDYGVQMQTTITIEENTSVNPLVTVNRTLPNGFAAGTSVGQMFDVGVGGAASSTATRTDTSFSYWLVGKIAHGKNEGYCNDVNDLIDRSGSSPLLRSDLGIREYLISNVEPAYILHSSKPGKSKTAKLDIYSYDIKFAVVTNGNLNPTWKLVPVSGGGGAPFLGAGRSRTHDLLLTFGPNSESGFQPSTASLNQHLAAQIKSSFETSIAR